MKKSKIINMKNRASALIALSLVILSVHTAFGNKKSHEQQIDKLFAGFDNGNSPGYAVLIIKDGQSIYKKCFGMANIEYNVPISESTRFHIPSDSKRFTALAILILEKQHKLSLNDNIRKYIPQLPEYSKHITINHLIHHTSGLREWGVLVDFSGISLDNVIKSDYLFNLICRQKNLVFTPGEKFQYSNTNYFLLSKIVENISGLTFREFTSKYIFNPLRMNDTFFSDNLEEIIPNQAMGYKPVGMNSYARSTFNYEIVGSTGLSTTLNDLEIWLKEVMCREFNGDKELLLKMEVRGLYNNGDTVPYMFGLRSEQYKGINIIGHGGGDAAYRTYIGRVPEKNLGIVILSNTNKRNAIEIALEIAEIFSKDKPDVNTFLPGRKSETQITPELFKKYTGDYELFPGFYFRIFEKSGRYYLQATGQSEFQIIPETDSTFSVIGFKANIIFHINEDGIYNECTLFQNGQRFKANKKHLSINEKTKEKYIGKYYCEELGTCYEVISGDKDIYIQHPFRGRHQLIQTAPNEFVCYGFPGVKFQETENEITGFQLNDKNVGTLNFIKIKS